MFRRMPVLFAIAVLGGGWFFKNYQVDSWQPFKFSPRPPAAAGPAAGPTEKAPLPPARPGDVIRIASFNIQVFGESKLADAQVTALLAQIVRKFDVVAIQEIRAKDMNFVQRFVEIINAAGVPYYAVVGPRLGDTDSKEQYAFLFDATRVELDRLSVYTVNDPDNRLHREPLVAAFRARGVPPNEAFTFTLVDVHTDPDVVADELNALDDVYRAVRDDGRGEDDVIMLGDFNADESHLGQLGAVPFLAYVVSGTPTNTHGTKTYDNILFDRRATTEFLGRGGVLDVMREFNLTLEQALKVSDHLPIWAEFSTYEGGRPGNVAARP